MTKKLDLPKLNKAFKKKWVKALRSGDYKQTDAYLYNRGLDGYCCLGVACKVLGADNDELTRKSFPSDEFLFKMGFDPKSDFVFGCSHDDDDTKNKIINKLANFNDDKKWTFKQIAAYIDRYL